MHQHSPTLENHKNNSTMQQKEKKKDLGKAPSEIEDADKPERSVIRDNDVRAAMGELYKALLSLKCQIQNEEKRSDDQNSIVPEPVTLENPIEESLW